MKSPSSTSSVRAPATLILGLVLITAAAAPQLAAAAAPTLLRGKPAAGPATAAAPAAGAPQPSGARGLVDNLNHQGPLQQQQQQRATKPAVSRRLLQVVADPPAYTFGVFNGTLVRAPRGVLAGGDNDLVSCQFYKGGQVACWLGRLGLMECCAA